MRYIILILTIIGCSKESDQAEVYSNRQSGWDYCHYQTEKFNSELKYIETKEMELTQDSVLKYNVNCPRDGVILITILYKKI